MKFTRERLAEIGEVWLEYARSRTDFYKAKLPDPIKQFLKPKAEAPSPPGAVEADSA